VKDVTTKRKLRENETDEEIVIRNKRKKREFCERLRVEMNDSVHGFKEHGIKCVLVIDLRPFGDNGSINDSLETFVEILQDLTIIWRWKELKKFQ
jgi:hypothetical protein